MAEIETVAAGYGSESSSELELEKVMTDRVEGTEKAERFEQWWANRVEGNHWTSRKISDLEDCWQAAFEAGRSSGEKHVAQELRQSAEEVERIGYKWKPRAMAQFLRAKADMIEKPAPPESGDKPKGDGRG